jgi:putative holliday junction resolvase
VYYTLHLIHNTIPPMTKKMLGIDYGEKRVGIAISDDECKMAFPRYILQNDGKLLEKISTICDKEDIKEIVIGQSRDYNNQPNTIMKKIEEFAKSLKEERGLEIHMEDEFLTSAEARRIQGNIDDIDASAAAIILRSFLEKEENT